MSAERTSTRGAARARAPSATASMRAIGLFGAVWGIVGVELLLIDAIVRLAPRALELRTHAFTATEALVLVVTLLFFAGVEGYKGFQKSFSPRVVARAFALVDGRHPVLALFAPLFTMALIAATPRRLVGSWALVTMIVGFVLLIRVLPDPWRGIVDAGVVVGLSWGALSIAVIALHALKKGPPDVDLAWKDAPPRARR